MNRDIMFISHKKNWLTSDRDQMMIPHLKAIILRLILWNNQSPPISVPCLNGL